MKIAPLLAFAPYGGYTDKLSEVIGEWFSDPSNLQYFDGTEKPHFVATLEVTIFGKNQGRTVMMVNPHKITLSGTLEHVD